LVAARRWRQRDSVSLAAAWRRRCGGSAQRDGGSAVAAARWMQRWRQRDIVTLAAAWRRWRQRGSETERNKSDSGSGSAAAAAAVAAQQQQQQQRHAQGQRFFANVRR
jgi:hypothetical protein